MSLRKSPAKRKTFFLAGPRRPERHPQLRSYKALTKELRNFSAREVLAARADNFEEIVPLTHLEEGTRNRRTRLTARMGLRFCGARPVRPEREILLSPRPQPPRDGKGERRLGDSAQGKLKEGSPRVAPGGPPARRRTDGLAAHE
jgi:hypothetical protein